MPAQPIAHSQESGTLLTGERHVLELIATGASRIATACPFCYIMIDDGVKGVGPAMGIGDDDVKVADISMHVLEALEALERVPADEE